MHLIGKNAQGKWVKRGGFYLHVGRESNGCLTSWADKSRIENPETYYPQGKEYDKLSVILGKLKQKDHICTRVLVTQERCKSTHRRKLH